ncbi:MAG TPA: hypothetical protein VKE51_29975 [Vicinamibacterales bacterium]|nr:hypothetical protein [Vicinamibacterales bacterium]
MITDLRAFRLGAVAPPLAVAAVSAAVLVWFGKAWIPAQQRYFNERNLRTLRSISSQIKANVDGFDPALDHAIDSSKREHGDKGDALQQFVKLFSQGQLEIVAVNPEKPAVRPGDPPNVRIQRVEGRNYLYLGYNHEEHRTGVPAISVIARADLDLLVAPYLGRTDFDAMLLLDSEGDAIAQQSSSGLELTSLDALLQRQPGAPPEKNRGDAFARLRGTTNLTRITIGATEYMLYAQPVQLSMRPDSADDARPPEEWTVCGLVRLDRFRAASATIPTTYWLWCGAALALVCCAIPLLKLRVLSPRERLRRIDSVSVAVAMFAVMALATVTALDLHVFGSAVPAALDDQLRSVAESMAAHLRQEIQAIDAQMTAFRGESAEGRTIWQQQLDYAGEQYQSLDAIRRHLKAHDKAPNVTLDAKARHQWKCDPRWACRSGVLAQTELGEIPYPFFKIMGWSDDTGWQRIKWSTSQVVTPFINVNDTKLPFAEPLRTARRLYGASGTQSGVSVFLSPNTGEKVTVFWRALPPLEEAPRDPEQADLLGETLATTPVSLTSPLLPKNVQFAVVDPAGRVLFHSDVARSLSENFFQEAEDNPTLKSLVATRARGAASGHYLGRAHRFQVIPLDVSPFGDPRWSLVTFEDAAVSRTANLQTLIMTASLFGVYALGLAALWALLGVFRPRAIDRWFWPTPCNAHAFRRAAVLNVAAALICCIALIVMAPVALVAVAVVLIAGAFAATFALVRRNASPTGRSATWMTDFLLARASLLFLIAAVPAMVCFCVSHAVHSELVEKRARSQLATQLDVRSRRIAAQTKRMALCDGSDRGVQPCDRVHSMVNRRTNNTLWDVDVPLTTAANAAPGDAAVDSLLLRSFLEAVYRPYNDLAADLLMTSSTQGLDRWRLAIDDERPSFSPREEKFIEGPSEWAFVPAITPDWPAERAPFLIALALIGVAWLLVRYVLPPLFAPELRASLALAPPDGAADDTSLLVIGPPGSPRTARLCRHPRVRVFDVRSLSFLDERIDPPSDVSIAADRGNAADGLDADWTGAIHEAALNPDTIVAVDHLEHRLDDQPFRERMLACLESIVYARDTAVWCSALRDPVESLDECHPSAPDRPRWARLFERFRREHLAIAVDEPRAARLAQSLAKNTGHLPAAVRDTIVAECRVAPELLEIGETLAARLPRAVPASHEIALDRSAILAEIANAAEAFYAALWSSCSADEKVALRQIAEEGVVNPNNQAAVLRLLRGGLVRRDRVFELMNETFRRFVIAVVPHEEVLAWEHEGVRVPWGSIATTGLTVAFGLAGLLLLTQEQLVDAWISYVPALAPALPTAWKVLAGVQKGRIDVTA